jgi:hypothetical protein
MSMTAAAALDQKLSIGDVIGDVFRIIGRNAVTFIGLALVLTAIPSALVGYFSAQLTVPGATPSIGQSLQMAWAIPVLLVGNLILQAALMHGAVADMTGRQASLGACLATGLRKFLPLLGLSIVMGVALMFGFILLLVPGIMMACAWAVAGPVLIAEGGVFRALGRSAELTRGNRWRIFGLFLIYGVAAFVIQMVLTMLIVGVAARGSPQGVVFLTNTVVSPIISLISGVIVTTGGAVLYATLRRLREGVGVDALASIFD